MNTCNTVMQDRATNARTTEQSGREGGSQTASDRRMTHAHLQCGNYRRPLTGNGSVIPRKVRVSRLVSAEGDG